MDEERIEYERPMLHSREHPLLYLADGTPLKRQLGYVVRANAIGPLASSVKFISKTKKKPSGKRKGY